MTQHITDTGRLERELSELQAEIQGSLKTVGQLREVQRHFGDLLDTYGKVKAFHEEALTEFSELQKGAERLLNEFAERDRTQGEHFARLAAANGERWREYQEKFVEVHKQLGAAQRNLRTELETQQRELEGSVEERLEAYARRLEEVT